MSRWTFTKYFDAVSDGRTPKAVAAELAASGISARTWLDRAAIAAAPIHDRFAAWRQANGQADAIPADWREMSSRAVAAIESWL